MRKIVLVRPAHGNEVTGEVGVRSAAHRVSSCAQGHYQNSRQWSDWGSLTRTVNKRIRTTRAVYIPGFSRPLRLMESSLCRVGRNGSSSAAVDIVLWMEVGGGHRALFWGAGERVLLSRAVAGMWRDRGRALDGGRYTGLSVRVVLSPSRGASPQTFRSSFSPQFPQCCLSRHPERTRSYHRPPSASSHFQAGSTSPKNSWTCCPALSSSSPSGTRCIRGKVLAFSPSSFALSLVADALVQFGRFNTEYDETETSYERLALRGKHGQPRHRPKNRRRLGWW